MVQIFLWNSELQQNDEIGDADAQHAGQTVSWNVEESFSWQRFQMFKLFYNFLDALGFHGIVCEN